MRVFDDFTLPGFWQDPVSVFQRHFSSGRRLQASPDGGLAVLGYRALRELGQHPAVDGTPVPPPSDGQPGAVSDLFRHALFAQVSPRHRHLRKAVLAGLNHAAVEGFRERAAGLVRSRVDALQGGPFDLFTDLALPVAADAWCAFMGYPVEDAPLFASAVERLTSQLSFSPDPSQAEDADAAAALLQSRTAALVAAGGGGPPSRIAAAVPEGDRGLAASIIASLLFDAIDTTAAGLAGVVAILLHSSVHHGRLSDAAFRDQAVEEALRLATPATLTVRQAREDLVFDGRAVAEGTLIWMWWAAGNCDPDVFPAPDRFQPGRPGRGMPFGVGAHSCLGHAWVKMLADVLIWAGFTGRRQLTAATPNIEWVSGGARRPKDQIVIWS
ncbi:cytochrome P450 [Inquilinus limosus]|uniref:cytochrome P450 n=1 Tax=Inquilinus limosus TaxID=171674 RepID=UPI000409936D|nr:cytochrome P450 [Inquilinus limosus]